MCFDRSQPKSANDKSSGFWGVFPDKVRLSGFDGNFPDETGKLMSLSGFSCVFPDDFVDAYVRVASGDPLVGAYGKLRRFAYELQDDVREPLERQEFWGVKTTP